MSGLKLPVRRVGSIEVPLPAYQTSGAVGLDLCAAIAEPCVLDPGERRLVPTGLALAIPEGYEGQVRPRSGLAHRFGITIVNSPGTIDPDFRGELGVVLLNTGREPFVIEPLARIAQLVICPVLRVELELCTELPQTERGSGGYGSTGV
ncbi:MAG TPA: dUTP diphosphatase [Polyangiaceae bacterium]